MNISVCYVKGQSSGYEMKKNRLSGKLEVGSETKTVKHNTLVYSQMFMFKWKNKEKKDHICVCEKKSIIWLLSDNKKKKKKKDIELFLVSIFYL